VGAMFTCGQEHVCKIKTHSQNRRQPWTKLLRWTSKHNNKKTGQTLTTHQKRENEQKKKRGKKKIKIK
jgi:hypothetical protein